MCSSSTDSNVQNCNSSTEEEDTLTTGFPENKDPNELLCTVYIYLYSVVKDIVKDSSAERVQLVIASS